MADENDIAQVVAIISAAYPNFNATEMTTEVYYQCLKDIPAELLKAATLQSISEAGRKFAPSVGELRGTVQEIQGVISGVPSSYQAYAEVQRQLVDNGGDYGKPVWSHPIVEQAVRLIGWRNLRMSENPAADRARFIQAYEQLVEQCDRDDMMLPEVRGYIEANGGKLLAPVDQMRRLAASWSVNKSQLIEPHTRERLE